MPPRSELSFRERNNLARRECYQRSKAKNDGKEFENYVANYHRETYHQKVWLQSSIPEEELYNSGFIHKYNQHRLDRIARFREHKGEPLLFSDYGMDFLALDEQTGTYHAGQAKNYTTKRVTAADIGTFTMVAMTRITGKPAYLYTTSDLECNLRECLQISGCIVHHKLPFRPAASGKTTVREKETDYVLRPEQEACIQQTVGEEGMGVWNMCCGFGKTTCLGHVLRKLTGVQTIVCLAPLRVSVKNLEERISLFVPEYRPLLVDSDAGGTTDVKTIESYLKTYDNDKVILFTTFESAGTVLTEVFANRSREGTYLVVDETHNLLSYKETCDFVRSFPNSLCMSATIPEEFYDEFPEAEERYSFQLSEAIRTKVVCDYEVIFPYDTLDKLPLELPEDIGKQCLFLASGMLLTGSRRCIVYCSSIEECGRFMETFQKVAEEYHGLAVWMDTIVQNTTARERDRIKTEFQEDTSKDMYLLTSVRILDEAVDIPSCDSECILSLSDKSSTIRIVQRLMRGGRLDPKNPNKKNHLFLWAHDMEACVAPLTLLRQQDPEFHKKVRVMGTDYNATDNSVTRTELNERTDTIRTFIQTGCMTLDERWEARRQEWMKFYNETKRTPSQHAEDMTEKRLGRWQRNMRQNKKNGHLSQERIDALEKTEGWKWEEADPFPENLKDWVALYQRNQRTPSTIAKDKEEKRLGRWTSQMRQWKKKGKLTQERIDALEKTEGWKWEEADPFPENLQEWMKFYQRNQRTPSQHAEDETERRLGKWTSDMRQKKKKGKLSQERIDALNNTEGWKWEGRL